MSLSGGRASLDSMTYSSEGSPPQNLPRGRNLHGGGAKAKNTAEGITGSMLAWLNDDSSCSPNGEDEGRASTTSESRDRRSFSAKYPAAPAPAGNRQDTEAVLAAAAAAAAASATALERAGESGNIDAVGFRAFPLSAVSEAPSCGDYYSSEQNTGRGGAKVRQRREEQEVGVRPMPDSASGNRSVASMSQQNGDREKSMSDDGSAAGASTGTAAAPVVAAASESAVVLSSEKDAAKRVGTSQPNATKGVGAAAATDAITHTHTPAAGDSSVKDSFELGTSQEGPTGGGGSIPAEGGVGLCREEEEINKTDNRSSTTAMDLEIQRWLLEDSDEHELAGGSR